MRKGFAPEETPAVLAPPDVEVTVEANPSPVETSSTPPSIPTASLWMPTLHRVKEVLTLSTKDGRGRARMLSESVNFTEWLIEQGVTPDTAQGQREVLLKSWAQKLGVPETGKVSIKFAIPRAAARLVLKEEDNMRNNRPLPPQRTFPKEQQEPSPEEAREDGDSNEGSGEEEEFNEADEVAPSQRGKTPRAAMPAPPPQVVYAMPPPAPGPMGYVPGYPYAPLPRNRGGRPPTNPNHPNYQGPRPASPVSRLMPRNEKIAVYRRTGTGKRNWLQEYTVEEIGGSLQKFVKEFVDPAFGDRNAEVNTYEVYEVGPDGKERGQPASIEIENYDAAPPSNDPLQNARGALELIEDIREMEAQRRAPQQELLDEMKRKAAGGGDMNNMMMLMMMERLMGGSGGTSPEALVKLVLEKMSGGGTPITIPMAAPPMGPSTPSALDKVIEALLANSLKPPPPPKSLAEQMGELKMMMSVFQPQASTVSPELVAVLARMNEKLDKPRGGIEEALGTFDKLTGVVKQLAPQVNMGGIAGAIQHVLTPELGKAVGNMLAGGITKAQESIGKTGGATTQTVNAQPVASVATTTSPQSEQTPEAIRTSVKAFHAEKDETKARAALLDVLLKMYEHPPLKTRLDEVLQAVLNGSFDPARGTLKDIVMSSGRPDLATPVFIDRTLAQLIVNAGGTPPEALFHKAAVVSLASGHIPTVAESEAKEKAEQEAAAKESMSIGANGAGPTAEVSAKKKEVSAQPSNM